MADENHGAVGGLRQKRAAEQMGGGGGLQSEPGKGSTFRLRLRTAEH